MQFLRSYRFHGYSQLIAWTRRCVPFLALSFALGACSPLKVVDALAPDDGYRLQADVAYGPEARQKLDVYRPLEENALAGRASNLVVVFIYGGSWKNGKRGNYRFVGQNLASRGLTVVIPDYRLYPEVRFPDFVRDSALAVAWTAENLSNASGQDPGIILVGHSAGAHIAALLALDSQYLEAAGLSPDIIRGMVGLAGPYAFDPTRYHLTRPIFATADDPELTKPTTFVRSGAPPILLLHGTEDRTVRPVNSEQFAQRLSAASNQVSYKPLDGVGHAEILLSLSEPFDYLAPVTDRIVSFIEAQAELNADRGQAED